MKIYLAGPCDTENRTTMMNIAGWLRREPGFEVYCPWELKIEDAWHMSQENWGAQVFWKDVEAIDNCDVFLMISLGRHSTAGTNWEQGYAYAKNKYIIVIQYTNDNTSLMTYSASDIFINSSENLVIDNVMRALRLGNVQEGNCYTTLT